MNNQAYQNSDIIHLHQALELAKIRRGFCAPNPSVGCIITNETGNIIAKGYHQEAGEPHAEIEALKNQTNLQNATAYITLEPCCHWGKTPPCTDVLIKAKVKRVVYGHQDPNPEVNNKSTAILEAAGIICDYLPTPEIQAFYASYDHWHHTKTPFITAKIATTLNGKIAGPNGERIQITGEALQDFTHYLRKHSDAILTTAKTINQDNPQLNARYENEAIKKPIYILDRNLTIDLKANIFTTAKNITIFHEKNANPEYQKQLIDKNIRCVEIPTIENQLTLPEVIQIIGQDGIHDLWVEAGGTLFATLQKENLLQRAFIYIAPKWLNDGLSAFSNDFSLPNENQIIHWEQMGNDVLCEIHW